MIRQFPIVALIVCLASVVLVPLGFVVINGFQTAAPDGTLHWSLQAWDEAWSQPGIRSAISNTAKRVLVTEAIALPTAVLMTWLLAKYYVPGRRIIDLFMWIAFFLPSIPVVLGWILLLDPQFGLINVAARNLIGIKEGLLDIYSFWGIVFAHLTTRAIAAKYIFLLPAFRNLNGSLEEAAEMRGANRWQIMRTIVLPVMLPAIAIAAVVSIVFSIESFEIELVLGPPTNFYVYSTKIYQLIREDPPQFQIASILSIAILLAMLPLFAAQRALTVRSGAETLGSHFRSEYRPLRAWRWPLFAILFALTVVITVVPLGAMIMGAFMNAFGFFNLADTFTIIHWSRVLNDPLFLDAAWNTVMLGAGAALLGTFISALVAYVSVRTRHGLGGFADLLSWLPAGIPGVILGLGMLWMFLAIPIFRPAYGTVAILVIATALANLTIGVQLIKSNMLQLDRDMEEASAVSGARWSQTFLRIVVPILGQAFITAGILIFAAATRNVSNVALLSTGNNRPLALLQVDYLADGLYESASIVGVFLIFLSVGVALGARSIAGRIGMRV